MLASNIYRNPSHNAFQIQQRTEIEMLLLQLTRVLFVYYLSLYCCGLQKFISECISLWRDNFSSKSTFFRHRLNLEAGKNDGEMLEACQLFAQSEESPSIARDNAQ